MGFGAGPSAGTWASQLPSEGTLDTSMKALWKQGPSWGTLRCPKATLPLIKPYLFQAAKSHAGLPSRPPRSDARDASLPEAQAVAQLTARRGGRARLLTDTAPDPGTCLLPRCDK